MDKGPAGFLSLLWGNQSQMYSASQWDALSPQPVPENLCQVKKIVADIYRAVERSCVPDQVKETLKQCTRQLEAECSNSTNLTQLVHRAANDSENVLLSRIHFLEALEDRINELSQLRAKFIDSRRAFRDEPNRLLTEGIREARHRVHDGMLSELSPLFKDIDTYYSEINVSLYAEEECLKKIRRSFRVTPDNKRRWEYIRNACREASDLLTSETLPPSPSTPPNTPQPANNKAPRNIKALAQTVINARRSLRQVHRDIAELTQQPQFSLLRLQSEYESGDRTCRHKINGLLEFSERLLGSFPQVRPLDDFRDHLLPSAAASSDQMLKEIGWQVGSTRHAVLSVFPGLKNKFDLFDHSLPIANASMQRMYHTLQGMVGPLRQQDDALRPAQLREGQRHFANLGQQWGAQLQSTSGAVYFPP